MYCKLSKPFKRQGQSNLFTPQESVGHLASVIDKLEFDNNGSMLSWDGNIL